MLRARDVLLFQPLKVLIGKEKKTFPTKREASAWAVRVESSKIDGYDISLSKLTVPEYSLEWYERYRKPDIENLLNPDT